MGELIMWAGLLGGALAVVLAWGHWEPLIGLGVVAFMRVTAEIGA